MTDLVTPPGWPEAVRPPGAPDWQRTAVAWLLDLCPPDYRAYDVLRRHPVVLGRFAAWHVAGAREAARRGIGAVRVDLADAVDHQTVAAAVAALEREAARLERTARAVTLVESALRGQTFTAKL